MTSIDPGIQMTFRRFTTARLLIFLFAVFIYLLGTGLPGLGNWLPLVIMLADCCLLLIYLALPQMRRLMKRAYLPVGIALSTIGPIIELHMLFSEFVSLKPDRSAFLLILQTILVLFIPLVITAWQYTMRTVTLYCCLTFFFDGFLTGLVYRFFQADFINLYIFPIMGIAFIRTIIFLFVGNIVANLVKTQQAQHQRLVEANQRLVQYASTVEQLTISRERNRVARELHDLLAHTMSGVAVELEGVHAMMRLDVDQAEVLLEQSLGAVREGLNETRRALQALRASPLEDLGLGLAIQNLVESITGVAGLEMEIQIEKELPDFPNEVQQSFYRVAQEALTNIVNHSQASRVDVILRKEAGGIKLIIRDNGIGFDEKTVDLQHKFGLVGIRERAEMIHGQLSITSQLGNGTEIALFYTANPVEE